MLTLMPGFRDYGHAPVIKYKVVVRGNGVVYDGESMSEANRRFAIFVTRSKKEADRSDPDTDTLFKNYQIVRQWYRPPE